MFKKALLSLICAVAMSMAAWAQLSHLPTKQIAGHTYYYYEVKNKESLADIALALGVTQQEILRYNPDASGKLDKKQLLFLPTTFASSQMSPTSQVRSAFGTNEKDDAATGQYVKHVIQPGENLFSIAKGYNATVEGILMANRALSPDRYVAGETIRLCPNSALPFYYEKSGVKFYNYKVQDGESFYSIARRYGVSPEDLVAANPDLKKPKKGKIMVVPKAYTEKVMGDMKSITLDELQAYYEPRIQTIYENLVAQKRNTEVNVGIVLPFQLHKIPAPRQGYLYTDFYKGFLLALDSAGHTAAKHINLHVWDTQHNLNVTDSLLALPQMLDMDLLIAPGEPKQLERVNRFGLENHIDVVNCFTTRNTEYENNSFIMQVNTPTARFSDLVLDWFCHEFADCHVLYLMDASSEGKEIFDNLKTHIEQKGMKSNALTVNGELNYETLSRHLNPGTSYVIVPSSSSRELLRKVTKALKQAKQERFDCEFVLVGYPEYVTYLKDFQVDLQDIETYVFSRFFNSKGFRTRDVEALYKKSFDGEVLNSLPNMMLYGFDLGMYIINTLGQGIDIETAPLYRGVQTGFKFERLNNWSGLVNRAIEIVHFSPDHKITTLVQQ